MFRIEIQFVWKLVKCMPRCINYEPYKKKSRLRLQIYNKGNEIIYDTSFAGTKNSRKENQMFS